MKTTVMKIAACALVLGSVAACNNTPAEQAAENTADMMEDQADAVRGNTEATDNMEDKADTLDNRLDGVDSTSEQNMENRAAGVRAAGENKADAMEDKADMVRDNANK